MINTDNLKKKLKEAEKAIDSIEGELPSYNGKYTNKSYNIILNLRGIIDWSEFKKAKKKMINL